MSDESSPLGNTIAQASTDTIYTVQVGDSLSKIAQTFYGDARRYPEIAARNNIANNSIVYIGQRLVIPAAARPADGTVQNVIAPTSPGGSAPATYDGNIIETVTTTAPRIKPKFWEDWRFWGLAAGTIALIWFLNRNAKR